MKIPKGKGFDIASGLTITVVLEEYTLIGTFLERIKERSCHDDPPIHVNVKVTEEPEFILLQLTCPLKVDRGIELPVGTIIAINVQQILFIAIIGTCPSEICEEEKV